jgi:hypothetical protein
MSSKRVARLAAIVELKHLLERADDPVVHELVCIIIGLLEEDRRPDDELSRRRGRTNTRRSATSSA